jgi:hypothetical protein
MASFGREKPVKGAKRGEVMPAYMPELDRDPAEAQAARISGLNRVKQAPVPKGQVAPVASLRERILAMSLFPNLYNRTYLGHEIS